MSTTGGAGAPTGWDAVAEDLLAAALLSGTRVGWASRAAHALTGAAPGSLVGADALELLVPADRPRALRALDVARRRPGAGSAPLRVRLAGGERRRLEVAAHALAGGRVLVTAWDVTARARAERELRHRAGHDELTGLPNRALLADRWEGYRARARRDPRRGAYVLVCDVDGLKEVNDAQGHAAGDRLLRAVARALGAHVRPGDTVARTGGDEFVVLVERTGGPAGGDAGAGDVEELLARLREGVPAEAGAGARVSVGWAVDDPARPAASVLAEADARMYADKRAARAARAAGAVPAPRTRPAQPRPVRDGEP
ncbi:GGDEF domain-containing protein [Kineococcus gypseus]|uniref:GGDEF domain-containing protein n=1 Tax=Kineococcus gypseus TaxID=1637102 RepID=UPI003D7CC3A3